MATGQGGQVPGSDYPLPRGGPAPRGEAVEGLVVACFFGGGTAEWAAPSTTHVDLANGKLLSLPCPWPKVFRLPCNVYNF